MWAPSQDPWRRTAPSESQEVLRRGASETGFWAPRPDAQSGAHSKKPRVVRGSERLATRLSELAGLVLAERVGFEPTVRETRTPDFESGAFDHSATFPEPTAVPGNLQLSNPPAALFLSGKNVEPTIIPQRRSSSAHPCRAPMHRAPEPSHQPADSSRAPQQACDRLQDLTHSMCARVRFCPARF